MAVGVIVWVGLVHVNRVDVSVINVAASVSGGFNGSVTSTASTSVMICIVQPS